MYFKIGLYSEIQICTYNDEKIKLILEMLHITRLH